MGVILACIRHLLWDGQGTEALQIHAEHLHSSLISRNRWVGDASKNKSKRKYDYKYDSATVIELNGGYSSDIDKSFAYSANLFLSRSEEICDLVG